MQTNANGDFFGFRRKSFLAARWTIYQLDCAGVCANHTGRRHNVIPDSTWGRFVFCWQTEGCTNDFSRSSDSPNPSIHYSEEAYSSRFAGHVLSLVSTNYVPLSPACVADSSPPPYADWINRVGSTACPTQPVCYLDAI